MKKTKAAPPSENARIEALAELLVRHDLSEIEVEEGGKRIRIARGSTVAFAPPAVAAAAPAAHAPAPAAKPAAPGTPPPTADTGDGNVSYITSPFVGTFYRSPNPESAPFVDSGTRIKKGQVICIVEAMKLMNEIEAEVDGVIVACLVENGHPVEYGEPLFKIKQG
jgi:acetyl-CoA carboxylase biotin carboxyl carrier protein